ITELLAGIAVAGIIYYGGASVIAGTRTQGAFIGFVITLFLLYEPFKRLVRTNYAIQQGLAGADRVFELLDTRPQVVDRPAARVFRLVARRPQVVGPPAGRVRRAVRDGIAVEDVSFAYAPGEPLRRHIDRRSGGGEVVALVSMSGGKSTLADLIPRFYDPTE